MERESKVIKIDTMTIVRTILLLGAVYLLYYLRDIVLVVLTAITIASAIEPAVKIITDKRVPRILAVIFIYVLIAAVFSGLIYFFAPILLADMVNLLNSFPEYSSSLELWNPIKEAQSISPKISGALSLEQLLNTVNTAFADITSGVFTTVSGIFGGIVSFILIVVLSFYFIVQENGIANFLRVVTPLKHEAYVIGLWHRSQQKIGLWLQGQLLLGVIVGILTFLGLSILGIREAMFLAAIAAIFELIPVFGIIISIIPALGVAFAQGGPTLALLIIGLYTIIQQFENHLIYPLVVKKVIGIPPILIILTLIVGAKLAGFLGIILAVPVAAVLIEIMNDLEKHKLGKRA